MKLLLTATFLILSINLFSQEWTNEEIQVLENFGLSKDDHRALIFQPTGGENCAQTHSNAKDALTSFFTTTLKRDITTYCVEVSEDISFNEIMDLRQMVKIYLSLNK